MPIRQVPPLASWPSGDSRDLAEIRYSPEELHERYGLTFDATYDDLDYFKLAAIELPDGSQAWLIKYRGDQYPGTLVRVDAGARLPNAKEQLKQALGLTDADLTWLAPGAETKVLPAAPPPAQATG